MAVVFDHAFIVDDYLAWKHAYFAVSWFILLAGVSNTLSARRRGFSNGRDVIAFGRRRLRSLLGPYLWITVLAVALLDRAAFTPGALSHRVLFADVQPQLYFVPLLLQLLLVFPLLYVALYRLGWFGRAATLAGVLLVGSLLAYRITLPWTLGAHYLLGASFLYLFVIGMLIAPLLAAAGRRHLPLAVIVLCTALLGERMLLRSGGTIMTHPPSNAMLPYTLGVLGICYTLFRLLRGSPPVRLLAALGHRSLDIFLYHYLFLLPFLPFRDPARARALPISHAQAVLVVVAIATAIAGALLLARCSRTAWWLVRRAASGLTAMAQRARRAPTTATPRSGAAANLVSNGFRLHAAGTARADGRGPVVGLAFAAVPATTPAETPSAVASRRRGALPAQNGRSPAPRSASPGSGRASARSCVRRGRARARGRESRAPGGG